MSNILQFKITLCNSNPKIWRQFRVDDSLTFHDFHLIIQTLMGWTNSHLHQFLYGKDNTIGDPELLERNDIANENKLKLSAIFDKPKMKMMYEYDFGDAWDHEL